MTGKELGQQSVRPRGFVDPKTLKAVYAGSGGLTKREYFAGLALQGFCSTCSSNGEAVYPMKSTIEAAVDYADALLEALAKDT